MVKVKNSSAPKISYHHSCSVENRVGGVMLILLTKSICEEMNEFHEERTSTFIPWILIDDLIGQLTVARK